MLNLEDIKKQLQNRRIELLGREANLEKDIRHSNHALSEDSEERATEEENDEVLDMLDLVTREEIEQIDHALKQIASGTYGNCQTCGKAIQPARLQMLPAATSCVNCGSG